MVEAPNGKSRRIRSKGSRQHVVAPGALHAESADVPFTEIPADHWALWLEQNEHGDLYKSGAVFKADAA